VDLKTGDESFTFKEAAVAKLADFWRWIGSDLTSNATRGVLAEFIVATALGIELSSPRKEWDSWDLTGPDGTRIEVKSAAYVQSWTHEKLSPIRFSIRPAIPSDSETGKIEGEPTRPADVYVFCVLKHLDKNTIDPLNLDQWDFYVLPTSVINDKFGSRESLGLSALQKATDGPLPYDRLKAAIKTASAGAPVSS